MGTKESEEVSLVSVTGRLGHVQESVRSSAFDRPPVLAALSVEEENLAPAS